MFSEEPMTFTIKVPQRRYFTCTCGVACLFFLFFTVLSGATLTSVSVSEQGTNVVQYVDFDLWLESQIEKVPDGQGGYHDVVVIQELDDVLTSDASQGPTMQATIATARSAWSATIAGVCMGALGLFMALVSMYRVTTAKGCFPRPFMVVLLCWVLTWVGLLITLIAWSNFPATGVMQPAGEVVVHPSAGSGFVNVIFVFCVVTLTMPVFWRLDKSYVSPDDDTTTSSALLGSRESATAGGAA